MVASTKKLFSALTRRGPHRALRGDLAFAGLPGVVYTPESGMNLAGVALGMELWADHVSHKEPTATYLAEVVEAIKANHAAGLFTEPQLDKGPGQTIAGRSWCGDSVFCCEM